MSPVTRLKSWFAAESWVVQVFLVVLATVVVTYLLRRLLDRLYQKARQTRTTWDDVILGAAKAPAAALLGLTGLEPSSATMSFSL